MSAELGPVTDELVIACDLGGSNLRMALVDQEMKIVAQESQSIRDLSYKDTIQVLKSSVIEFAREHPGAAIGIAAAGNVDTANGTISYRKVEDNEPRAKTWSYETFDVVTPLSEALNVPIAIDNDGNAACIAEWKNGAAQGHENVVSLTLGTYVGSGLVLNNRLVRKRSGAPLLGGMLTAHEDKFEYTGIFACGVGLKNSATAHYGAPVDGLALFEKAQAGDQEAREIYRKAGKWLGVLVASSINMFDPEIVVLNGPVMDASTWMLPEAQKIIDEYGLPSVGEKATVATGQFTHNASLIGAASIAFSAAATLRMSTTSTSR